MTTSVEFKFVLPNGNPMANQAVVIQLTMATHNTNTGIAVPRPIQMTTDESGMFTLPLWPSSVPYVVHVQDASSDAGLVLRFVVPEVAVGVTARLQDLLLVTPVIPDNPTLVLIQAAASSAQLAATNAAASAAAAGSASASAVASASGAAASAAAASTAASLAAPGALLTNLVAGANSPISTTDTILVALAKLQAQINFLIATGGATAITWDGGILWDSATAWV